MIGTLENHLDDLVGTKDAAQYLNLSTRTLERFRETGGGPIYRRHGLKMVRYRRGDLEAWSSAQSYQHRAAEMAARNVPR